MVLTCLFVGNSSLAADLPDLHAVAVLVVVPVDESVELLTSMLFIGKWLAGVISSVFHCPEYGCGQIGHVPAPNLIDTGQGGSAAGLTSLQPHPRKSHWWSY
jgi:hypothetical protein